ncbi:3-deoxy-7-phosphoheptulonate synthase [Micromonospora sp. NPDC048871]|uniref:3-deoxy-7-phosphoheptulonate synthase n=1 Tax=unclassified Micromonospora TaxID=2617518 RepID=UPI002E1211C7|nr:3-deoxy-7-phosphoheptulonate synthase [Micromonospora sp. NBC_01739]
MTDEPGTSLLEAPRPLPAQQPPWDPGTGLPAVLDRLRAEAPLVTSASCCSLHRELGRVAAGEALVLQAGDCAERFADATEERTAARIDLVAALADIIEYGTGRPVVRIGRMAGQYAKPRSQDWERTPDGQLLPVYRGDAVNSPEPTPAARVSDARRLLAAYEHAARTLDHLFLADLLPTLGGADSAFSLTYTGHEALLLDYEQALVRDDDHRGGRYASSGHFLWIGERTRQATGAHIEFAERISNPVGVKVGPDAAGTEIAALTARLTRGHDPGRLSLIVRMGDRVGTELPRLLKVLGPAAERVLWVCDPMHGNTRRNRHGQKTRVVAEVIHEVRTFLTVLGEHRLTMSGLHLETTPEPVGECVDSATELDGYLDRYTSACDPRLNPSQAERVVSAAVEAGWGRGAR